MKVLALGALAAAALAAQIPMPAPPPADGPKQAVSGRVLDSVTGRPVRGARVALMLQQNELAGAQTDFEGRFRIDEAPVGEWRAFAVKSGYAVHAERLTVPAAQPKTGVELRVDRFAVIAGRVLDRRNRPVVGAMVAVWIPRKNSDWSLGGPMGANIRQSRTDDRGDYRVWNLPPGAYAAAVFPPSGPAEAGLLSFDASGTFYPGVLSLDEAERVEVDWGQVREGVDLRLGPPAETRLDVQAALPGGGSPCERCYVQVLLDAGESFLPVGGAPLDGQNRLAVEGLSPGQYLAHLRGSDETGTNQSHGLASVTLSEGRPEQTTIVAYGEAPLRGRIVLEDPPEGPWRGGIRVMPPEPFLRLGMFSRGMSANLTGEGGEVPFELTCFPGEVELQVMGQGQGYVAGIALDGKPLESPKLTVPPGGIAGDLVLRMRFDSGVLEGSLNLPTQEAGSGPGVDYLALARPAGAGAGFLRPRVVPVQPNGSFRRDLAPGTYELIAVSAGQGFQALADPSYQAKIREFIRRIEIKAGQTSSVTLDPVPAP